jgi:acetate kinase
MPLVLALNPGSNSLKFDLVDVAPRQVRASDAKKLLSGTIDDIGKQTKLLLTRDGQTTAEREGDFSDFSAATERVVEALREPSDPSLPHWDDIQLAAVRVVHGGDSFQSAVPFSDHVRAEIERREPLAPLHNANSLRILDVLLGLAPNLPLAVAFDTAFHHTIPEVAWRYPIPRDLADQHHIRRFGFHGLSHRYQLERYAQLAGRPVEEVSIVTTHLESGSSACAIRKGQSIDTSMGFTPLEGLMMGTRSGSIDPAILPFLMRELNLSADAALEILEKKSGLLGISGVSLDTRILRKREDAPSKLAIQIFGYHTLHYVGAYLAILGQAEAVVFGGGIGENTPEVRTQVCAGLTGWGFRLDEQKNETTCAGDTFIHHPESPLAAWVIHPEEGLQLAHECAQAIWA